MALLLREGSGKDAIAFLTDYLGVPLENFSAEAMSYFSEEPRFTFYFCLTKDIRETNFKNYKLIRHFHDDYSSYSDCENTDPNSPFNNFYVTKPSFISNYHICISYKPFGESTKDKSNYRMQRINRFLKKKSVIRSLCCNLSLGKDGRIEDDSGILGYIKGYPEYKCTALDIEKSITPQVEWFKPLRMIVKSSSQINFNKEKGFFISAIIETGVLDTQIEKQIMVIPLNMTFSIFCVRHNAEIREFSRPGDAVEIEICVDDRKDFLKIGKGDVLCISRFPVRQIKK
jgi:hypothetical protein